MRALRAQTYGKTIEATTLILHMLGALTAGEREFRRTSHFVCASTIAVTKES